MVKKIIAIFNKEFGNINEAALVLGFFAFLSQILGLVRDKLFAYMLGTSAPLDVYNAAFRIPDFLYVSVASFASVTVILPFLVERTRGYTMRREQECAARPFLSSVFTVFAGAMLLLAALLFLLMPFLAPLLVPGFTPVLTAKFVMLSRIMLLSPILLGLSNLFGAVTQLYKKFFMFALAPLLYNAGIIGGVLFLYPTMGLSGIAWGVVIGAGLHLAIQLPSLISTHLVPRFTRHINWNEIRAVVKISLPRTLALSANNLALLVITSTGSTIGVGAISVFTYAYHLQSVPLALIGVSYSVAAFPALAHYFAERNLKDFVGNIMLSARQVVFWSLPVIALFVVLRAQIVRVILGAGKFNWDDTRLTAAALALFAISVVAQSLTLLLVRGFYAAGNTKSPLYINLFSSLLIIALAQVFLMVYRGYPGLALSFERLFRVDGIADTSMLMLPLAYTVGTLFNNEFLYYRFKRLYLRDHARERNDFKRTFFQSFFAALILGVVAYFSLELMNDVFMTDTFLGILGQGITSGVLGIIFWAFTLEVLGSAELEQFKAAVKNRFWKSAPIPAPQEEIPA